MRTRAGGIGDDVAVAVRAGDEVIAGAADAASAHGPPFRERTGVWAMVPIALRAHAVVARGTRAVAAAGKQVFALDGAAPKALPDAPGAVLAAGASAGGGVVIATDHGVARLDGARWQPVAAAPATVLGFAGDRWAIVATGAFDLRRGATIGSGPASLATIAWPAGFAPTAVAADAGGDLVAGATGADGIAIAVVRAGQTTFDVQQVPATALAAPLAPVAAVAIDRDGRVLVALRDGRIAVRDGAAWTAAAVRDDLPASRPGAPPAASH